FVFSSMYAQTTYCFTLSLHDALPIFGNSSGLACAGRLHMDEQLFIEEKDTCVGRDKHAKILEDDKHDDCDGTWNWYILHPQSCKDRKSTRLNSSHVSISYAVFCLKKK